MVSDGKLLVLREVNLMKEKCLTCGKEMSDEEDSLNLNCGGDCLECMASHGDLACIAAVFRIKSRKLDTGSIGDKE